MRKPKWAGNAGSWRPMIGADRACKLRYSLLRSISPMCDIGLENDSGAGAGLASKANLMALFFPLLAVLGPDDGVKIDAGPSAPCTQSVQICLRPSATSCAGYCSTNALEKGAGPRAMWAHSAEQLRRQCSMCSCMAAWRARTQSIAAPDVGTRCGFLNTSSSPDNEVTATKAPPSILKLQMPANSFGRRGSKVVEGSDATNNCSCSSSVRKHNRGQTSHFSLSRLSRSLVSILNSL
mmetsp:Transcript_28626/g.51326  ORF Transcript_28626/g.51326 Transcript_28626/m.51326 type:complete len:237 (-) Transcript_28626:1125-1835(-)